MSAEEVGTSEIHFLRIRQTFRYHYFFSDRLQIRASDIKYTG